MTGAVNTSIAATIVRSVLRIGQSDHRAATRVSGPPLLSTDVDRSTRGPDWRAVRWTFCQRREVSTFWHRTVPAGEATPKAQIPAASARVIQPQFHSQKRGKPSDIMQPHTADSMVAMLIILLPRALPSELGHCT
mmetsp:Transcript_11386/g.34226  ORF Transcript_11386/g.34226 Transcript_11386/m.34226 type:complete len:135 (-) Transcript_11386:1948-2352(-)